MRKVFCILSVVFLSVLTLHPQSSDWVTYDDAPTGMVMKVAIDSSENIWLGLFGGGVAKYENSQWVVYNKDNSVLTSNQVNDIYVDSHGNVWIATGIISDGGLIKFDGENWTLYNKDNSGIPGNAVDGVVEDRDGNLWVGTIDGLAKFDGQNWMVWNTENSEIPSDLIYTIAISPSGVKWLGTPDGLVKFDGSNWTIYNSNNSDIPQDEVDEIAIDNSGNIWFNSGDSWEPGGLVKYDGNNFTVYNTGNSDLPDDLVNCIAPDVNGIIWIGTSEGLSKFDGSTWVLYGDSNSPIKDGVNDILIDKAGNKWLGTNALFGKGLIVYREGGVILGVSEGNKTVIKNFKLFQNYPNPFNSLTTISFYLPENNEIKLSVFDLLGHEVDVVCQGRYNSGEHKVIYSAENLSTGVYFYKLQAGKNSQIKKMIYIK